MANIIITRSPATIRDVLVYRVDTAARLFGIGGKFLSPPPITSFTSQTEQLIWLSCDHICTLLLKSVDC